MKIKKKLIFVSLVASLIFYQYNYFDRYLLAEEAKQAEGEERTHIIKKGDTLWDISGEYLKNPFLWPNIWEKNKYIKNPDLIYPDHRLIIPYIIFPAPVTGELESPLGAAEGTVLGVAEGTIPASPSVQAPDFPPAPESDVSVEAPLSPPSPPAAIPMDADESYPGSEEPLLIGAELIFESGYIADNIESSGVISDSSDGRILFASGDNVNLILNGRGEGISVGDEFTIFRKPAYVTHPKTKRKVGMLFIPVGVLEINRVQGGEGAGRIIKSYYHISPGDYIQPYREVSSVIAPPPITPILHGYVIESQEGEKLIAEYSIVYLDRGSSDGIFPGMVFHVVSGKYDDIIGELKIISVQATTSTALVTKSVKPFDIGSKVVTPSK